MRAFSVAIVLALAGCPKAGPHAPDPAVAVPTSFAAATRTWQVNAQLADLCTVVDIAVCSDGDVTQCPSEHLSPYPCPPEGIWASAPWQIYELSGTCWLRGEEPASCAGEPGCQPVTREVDCPTPAPQP